LRHGHHSLARKRALGLHGGVARPMVTWGSPIVWTPSCGNSWMFFFIPKVRHIDDLVGRLGWFFFFSLQIYSPQRWEILMRLRKYWDYSYVDLSNDRECTNMAIHCLWDFGWFWRSRF
jgi:hypothetical protein